MRDKLAELAQHRRLAYQRRIQSADHFEEESVRIFAAIDFHGRREQTLALGRRNQRRVFRLVEKQNSTQAGAPVEAVEDDGQLVPRLAPKIKDDQLVKHAPIVSRAKCQVSSVCHEAAASRIFFRAVEAVPGICELLLKLLSNFSQSRAVWTPNSC